MSSGSPTVVDRASRHAQPPEAIRCRGELLISLHAAEAHESPFRHWLLRDALPANVVRALAGLPFAVHARPAYASTREAHNPARRYLDPATIAASPACRAVAEALQHPMTVAAIARITGAALSGSWLRIELAQDLDGFWLEPHTDMAVKRFTLQCYLGPADQPDLGTDLYRGPADWAGRAPFAPGAALAFVPSDRSWHGFERRPIAGVRRSLIVNYVTDDWRDRSQLSYPDTPVYAAAD